MKQTLEALTIAAILLALICTGGCSSKIDPIMREAETFTLYSIDGDAVYKKPKTEPKTEPKPDAEEFHGYPVLGKVDVTDAGERKALLAALDRGIRGSDGSVAGCFIPRHAIRTVKGKDTLDYVICFQCMSISTYKNGERGSVLTTGEPAEEFNAFLKKKGVPVAKKE